MNPLQIFLQIMMVIEKNIKRLLTSKISASLILFGPLLLIAIIGLAFQTSDYYGIKIGVYAAQYDNVTTKILDAMTKNKFEVQKTLSSDECISKAKDSQVHLCILFPEDYSKGRLEFYVDYSRINLVYVLINKISESVTSLSSQISLSMTQELLDMMDSTSGQIGESLQGVQSMTDDARMLAVKLDSLKSKLESTNIQTDYVTLNKINDRNSDLNKNIAETKTGIRDMKDKAVSLRDKLQPISDNMDNILNNMDESLSVMNCTAHNSEDLTAYLDQDDFAERLLNSPDSTCSLIFTFKHNLESQRSDMQSGISDLNDLIEKSDTIESQITDMESSVRYDSQNAAYSLTEFNEAKNNLTNELEAMSVSTNESILTLENMNEKITLISQGFNKINSLDAENVVRPIQTSIKSLVAKKQNTLEILFPALILIVLMFVSILLGNVLIMREKMSKAYFRNRIIPAHDYISIAGTYITSWIISILQSSIIILIGIIAFNINLEFNISSILIIISLASIIFTSIGIIIGYAASSEETSTLTSIVLAVILLLFSNILIPVESMSRIAGMIAEYTPFSMAEAILRKNMLFGATSQLTSGSLFIILLVQCALLLVLAYLAHIKFFNKKR
jgi:ABC-type multidrug transport system permease subunit